MDLTYKTLNVHLDGSVGVIKLNRPSSLNSLSHELCDELMAALGEMEADDAIRAVVLTGEGRAFSAGYDISNMAEHAGRGVVGTKFDGKRIRTFIETVWRFPKPTIVAANGFCLAGACELAMLCDLTIAAESCKFGEPEIRFSSASPTLIMPWLVPMKVAKELLLAGSLISAQRAYEIGMVNEVVPDDQLMDVALRRARLIATVAPLAVRLTKEGINRSYEIMGLMNALAYHDQMAAMVDGSETEELREFTRISSERGLRAALDWRDEQFKAVDR